MSVALFRVAMNGQARLARGTLAEGPAEFLASYPTIDDVFAGRVPLLELLASDSDGPVPVDAASVAPLESQDVWASGVTFPRSRDARTEEATLPDHYDRVYDAERPELFLKATAGRVRGPGQAIGIRSDSTWNVPEGELALALNAKGQIFAYTVGNDMSSRSIEGANPLYLPQAKVYRWSCAIGPGLVPIEEAPPVKDLKVTLTVYRDGEAVYADQSSIGTIKRTPSDLVSWLTRGQDFPTGVVLLTGTPLVPNSGFTLHAGDEVTVDISGVGQLTNPVAEIPAGSPPREETM